MRWRVASLRARWMYTIPFVLLVGWWFASGWYSIVCRTNDRFIGAHSGVLTFESGPLRMNERPGFEAWRVINYPDAERWRWAFVRRRGGSVVNALMADGSETFRRPAHVEIPVSPVIAAVGLPATRYWFVELRRRMAFRGGACRRCGYDRRGLAGGADAKCPECGTLPAPASK